MANFAALIDVLSISGSRLSDGSPNASGKVWFFEPGGNTPVNVYSDAEASAIVTAPVTLTDGGLVSRSDYPDGIFATQPIRLYIEDVDGNLVGDLVWIPATAGDTGLSNAGWTDSTIDGAFTKLFTSTGGQDGKYKESDGATERTTQDKFRELGISVKDFGAVGNGVAIDTTAIQSAVSRVKALGGGVVYFPPGTYLIDQAITLSSGTGIKFVGSGPSATFLTQSNATANIFTVATCTDISFEGMTVKHTSSTTGGAFVLTSVNGLTFTRCTVAATAPIIGFRYGMYLDVCTYVSLYDCQVAVNTVDASARSFLLSASFRVVIVGGQYTSPGGTYGSEITGNSGRFTAIGATFGEAVRLAASVANNQFTFIGCAMVAPSIATATDMVLRTFNCAVDGYSVNVTTGGTVTPDRQQGNDIKIVGTTTGSAYTINVPTPAPTSAEFGVLLSLQLNNSAGAPITGWGLAAGYHATAPSAVDGERTNYLFRWDGTLWRQIARSVST